jgi:excisionase family DNA binding protein
MRAENHNYLTSQGVGQRLGVGPTRVRQLAREGRLEPAIVLPGGTRLFEASAVEQFKETRRRERV